MRAYLSRAYRRHIQPIQHPRNFLQDEFLPPKMKELQITEKSNFSVCISLGNLWNISPANSHQTERTAQSCSFDCFANFLPSLAQSWWGSAQKNLVCSADRFLVNCKKRPCSLMGLKKTVVQFSCKIFVGCQTGFNKDFDGLQLKASALPYMEMQARAVVWHTSTWAPCPGPHPCTPCPCSPPYTPRCLSQWQSLPGAPRSANWF